MSVEEEERVLDDVTRWVETVGDTALSARHLGWRGRLRYRQGRFNEAAELHLESTRGLPRLWDRFVARSMAGSSLLEAFEHERALAVAEQLDAELSGLRFPLMAARARWLVRAAQYRMGSSIAADAAFVSAVESLGVANMVPLVCLTEAAIGWRANELELAQQLARKARHEWERIRTFPEMAVLAACLAVAAGADDTEVARIRDSALATRADVRVQAIALLRLARRGDASDVEVIAKASAHWPVSAWHRRLDVLSVAEARRTVGLGAT
jgi:hypothetical protein